ncbi:MAG TPA: hypothetical protein VNA26_01815 [Chitinophagaceae bacterium]|nr:hypothetical protein [Chitinophagaceae bacterium]
MRNKLLLSFLLLIIFIIVMRWQGQSLINTVSPHGIIDLEFAKTSEKLSALKTGWIKKDVTINIYLDFFFIISYTFFFILSCLYVKKKLGKYAIASVFITIAVVAGVLDVLENCLMLFAINHSNNAEALKFTYYFALLKFILIGILIIYLVLSITFLKLNKCKSFGKNV